jgi:hypothetical protein
MSKHKLWSEEENAILREIWASSRPVKEGFHRLPNRGERAIVLHAQALGISGNRKIDEHARSTILSLVHREMKSGASMSSLDVVAKYSCHVKHAGELLKASRNRAEIHVAEWIRTRTAGPYLAVYAWGNKPDAVRPAAKTSKEYNRRRWIKQRMKEGKLVSNVFAVAMAQILDAEPPKPIKGRYESRVYQQSMSLRDFEEAA